MKNYGHGCELGLASESSAGLVETQTPGSQCRVLPPYDRESQGPRRHDDSIGSRIVHLTLNVRHHTVYFAFPVMRVDV